MVCEQCKENLPSDGDFISCGKCSLAYHYECSGMKKSTWRAKSLKLKSEWECIQCK